MFCLKNKVISLFKILALVLVISPVHAANINQEIVDITAQYLLLDENKGISKYKGGVFFKKGTLSIKADEVTLHFNNGKLAKAMITGSPANVLHYPDNEAKVHSQAKEMEYFVAENRLTLKGQAFVDQGDRHFSGEKIEYDTRQRTITAAGNQSTPIKSEKNSTESRKGRVHVIIGPSDGAEDKGDVVNAGDIGNTDDEAETKISPNHANNTNDNKEQLINE